MAAVPLTKTGAETTAVIELPAAEDEGIPFGITAVISVLIGRTTVWRVAIGLN
jgi:hypothetical protein